MSYDLFIIFIHMLFQVELSCPKEMAWKVNLYRGYIAICHPDDHHLNMVSLHQSDVNDDGGDGDED